jgi:hypothetical protein
MTLINKISQPQAQPDMSTSEWQCDRSINSNRPSVNDNVPPSDDPLRPWKNHRVPSGSTVGQVLSTFNEGARQQFLNDVQPKASQAAFTPGSLAVYHGIEQSTPVRTKLEVLVEAAFNRTFRPSRKGPLSTDIVMEARSGTSSRYRFTEEGDFELSIKWHTKCGSCKGNFGTGERMVEMEDGRWRHYWQYPIYGESFEEILDVYKEEDEDGVRMSEGDVVWSDFTRTRFHTTGGRDGQSWRGGRLQNGDTHRDAVVSSTSIVSGTMRGYACGE